MAAPQTVTATFNGTTDNVAVTWTDPGGAFSLLHGKTITDGGGGVVVHATNRTQTGCTVNASAPFSGTVDLLIYPH